MSIYDNRGTLVLVNIAIYLFAIIKYKDVYKGINYRTLSKYWTVGFILSLYSIFAFAEGDTYHYEDVFKAMGLFHEAIHVEPFYYWLSTLTSSYFVWRTMIWGTATVLYILTLKKLKLDPSVIGFLMPGLLFYQFSLSRGSLGFALLLFSLVWIYYEKKNALSIILGVAGVICSVYLHRSIAVFLLILPFAIFMPFSKKAICLYLAIFPVLYGIVSVLPSFLLNNISFSEDTLDSANMYLEMTETVANLNGIIQLIWKWSGILCVTLLTSFFFAKNKTVTDRVIYSLTKYAFLLVYMSFLFYGQDMSSFISSRTLHAAGFPLMISACSYYSVKERGRFDRICLLLLSSYGFFSLVYFFWKFSA